MIGKESCFFCNLNQCITGWQKHSILAEEQRIWKKERELVYQEVEPASMPGPASSEVLLKLISSSNAPSASSMYRSSSSESNSESHNSMQICRIFGKAAQSGGLKNQKAVLSPWHCIKGLLKFVCVQ